MDEDEYWCVMANIKHEIPYGPGGGEIKSGVKKFKAGAKVHIVGAYYGPAECVIVVGQHRKIGKYISCVIRATAVENLRVKKIYSPQIIEFLHSFKPNGASITANKHQSEELMQIIPIWASRA
jgi:hypothetical protein